MYPQTPHIPGDSDGLDVFLVVLFGVLILGSLYGAVWLWEVFTSPPYAGRGL